MAHDVEELYQATLALLEKWDLDAAEEKLQQILELDPDHARAWNKLGVVFARRKDLRQAEDCFNLAIQKDPQLSSPYSNLGNVYAEHGWTDRAKAAYEQALVLDPGNPTATHNLGVLYRKAGDIGRGVDLLKQANKSDRHRYRGELQDSTETRKIVRMGWIIVIGLGLIVLFLLNR